MFRGNITAGAGEEGKVKIELAKSLQWLQRTLEIEVSGEGKLFCLHNKLEQLINGYHKSHHLSI